MSARMIIIAAMDQNRGVGRLGEIPWHLPEDLKRMRSLTLGGSVCYGRRTWESLPMLSSGQRYLLGRYNILLGRSAFSPLLFDPEGSASCSVQEALHIAEAQELGPLFVLGGTRAWKEALKLACGGVPTLAYLTQVEGDFDCDTFFPTLSGAWTRIQEGPIQKRPIPSRLQLWSNF